MGKIGECVLALLKTIESFRASHQIVNWLVERLYQGSIDTIISFFGLLTAVYSLKRLVALFFDIGISVIRALKVFPCVPRPHSHRSN